MILPLLLLLLPAYSADRQCQKVADYRAFYHCSIEQHPLAKVAEMKVNEGEALIEQANQWKNPELELKSVAGTVAGENNGSTEVNARFPLSQIWQRSARRAVAESEKKISVLSSKENLLSAKKDVLRSMYRWRQIDDELSWIDETLQTFGSIQSQLRGRRVRGAEQELTLNLVDLARSDYELKKNLLSTEKLEILSKLKGIWGPEFEMKNAFLPPMKTSWPEIKESPPVQRSLEVQKVLVEFEKAQAEKRVADAESWPEISVGPSIQRSTTGTLQTYSYGANLSMTLPLFSLNSGSRKFAAARATEAEFMSAYTERVANLEGQIHLRKYQSALESMKRSIKRETLVKQHERSESLFRQGMVPGGLMIEAHRQLTEYIASQNSHENAALEAYFELKTLRGEEIEDILK